MKSSIKKSKHYLTCQSKPANAGQAARLSVHILLRNSHLWNPKLNSSSIRHRRTRIVKANFTMWRTEVLETLRHFLKDRRKLVHHWETLAGRYRPYLGQDKWRLRIFLALSDNLCHHWWAFTRMRSHKSTSTPNKAGCCFPSPTWYQNIPRIAIVSKKCLATQPRDKSHASCRRVLLNISWGWIWKTVLN